MCVFRNSVKLLGQVATDVPLKDDSGKIQTIIELKFPENVAPVWVFFFLVVVVLGEGGSVGMVNYWLNLF